MIIQAVVETTDTATLPEIVSAAAAVNQALGMTVAAVPFLESVAVTVYDEDGNVVDVNANAESE